MPLEVGLWRVDGAPVRVTTRRMALESRLEELIEADPAILGTPLLLIGRQVPTPYGKFLDLLGIDADGNLHVLELKRDRTPRDVVAQILDYGSWVQGLTNDEVRDIHAEYAARRHDEEAFDQAFAARFGASPPEELNSAHSLTVVASEVDPATERIVTYLSTGYGVPLNVLFFRYFEDDGRSYLARTALVDDTTATPARVATSRGKQEPWNGQDWYVAFGHQDTGGRNWDDARKYGFISAGGGEWYSRTLRGLPQGARIFTHIPSRGYVGIGTVIGEAQPFEEARLAADGDQREMKSLDLRGSYLRPAAATGDGDSREWIVPVDWEATVPQEQAFWVPGLFANQNSACKLRARFTIDEVSRRFGIDK
ncbi:endonuclease NucS domain-containing protein [Streptomyces sp. NPDC048825]|uniref:endonuclease NucS domain-containing protein n=1 Tax=Streptomyces sp. NPDC048825 TaxID=3365592 RepID=UPI00371A55BA